ncbi:HDOD domain protein [mine drainage metagenome]|uniref:HDOD domain protein n=1 Tax=mine drainage metagenome TaxID=410659 RepID=A0A1J5QN28_9ZZZZ
MYFSGHQFLGTSAAITGGKRINPGHALILELMSAVQQEAEPRDIETLLKRDVTLSFKLLRYINSPWFGLATHVESVRHALSIIGYQQLLKWFTLLAITAGGESSPALAQTAMVRARLMELVGAKLLDKSEADNLFVTGMLSLLDRCMGVPMEEILQHVNLPPAVSETLMQPDGKYHRFLSLALACEGNALPEELQLDDIDVRAANIAHLEALEWATQTGKISLS